MGIDRAEALEIGKRYRQNAIVFVTDRGEVEIAYAARLVD